MIAITKAEKEAISKRFPNVHIVRTMKQKSKRHRYYCTETRGVTQLLSELRPQDPTKSVRNNKKRGAHDTTFKERK